MTWEDLAEKIRQMPEELRGDTIMLYVSHEGEYYEGILRQSPPQRDILEGDTFYLATPM